MPYGEERSFIAAGSIEEALAARRHGARILAGGTWIMRDPRRGIGLPHAVVALHRIPELSRIDVSETHVAIGAMVSHAALADALAALPALKGLAGAARGAANPAIRRVATVGGNLCTSEFAAADLVPALLACEAETELQSADGTALIPMDDFLRDRDTLLAGAILTRVRVPLAVTESAHVRLPLRKAGDYPVAIVSVAAGPDGMRIAVGSVEGRARRWSALETAIAAESDPLTPERVTRLAEANNDFTGRDSLEADGWYRRQVLPALAGRAFASLRQEALP
ncbi:FAD binding domain-containing protein [Pseudomonas sp. R2.Fl]|nr:FAD binding domain-containing protein [Pseudomonas sp. R2.Fl]